jgi:hypothetical protein
MIVIFPLPFPLARHCWAVFGVRVAGIVVDGEGAVRYSE